MRGYGNVRGKDGDEGLKKFGIMDYTGRPRMASFSYIFFYFIFYLVRFRRGLRRKIGGLRKYQKVRREGREVLKGMT